MNSTDRNDRETSQIKRVRTKGVFACEACRIRRSKCDLVDHLGCHRCKQLRTRCSLQDVTPSRTVRDEATTSGNTTRRATSPRPSPKGDVAGLASRLEMMEQEMSAIRASMSRNEASPRAAPFDYTIQTGAPPTTSPLSSTGQSTGPFRPGISMTPHTHRPNAADQRHTSHKGKERDEAWFRRNADPETFSKIDRGIHGKEERGLRDPIAEGIITRRRAEEAFLLFRHHFATIHPHPGLSCAERPLPDHPFLLSASLYYATRCLGDLSVFTPTQVSQLEELVHANIIAYIQGCRPSIESIMAAFIMSLLPCGAFTIPHHSVDVDAFRMIGLAYAQVREFGQTIFIARLLRSLQAGIPVQQLEQPLNDARWFMSVINRSAWFTLSRAHGAAPPTLIEDTQRGLLAFMKQHGIDCDVDRHLMIEHASLDILFKHVRQWQALQMNIFVDSADLEQGNDLTRSVCAELEELKLSLLFHKEINSLGYLSCHITYCKWWSTVRNVWAIYHLPYPSFTEAVQICWVAAMELAAQASHELLSSCLNDSWRLESIPKAIGHAVVLCHALLSSASLYFQNALPDITPPAALNDGPLLQAIEVLLAGSGYELSSGLARTQSKLQDYAAQLERQSASDDSFPSADDNLIFSLGLFSGAGDGPFTEYNDFFAGIESGAGWRSMEYGAGAGGTSGFN